MKLSPKIILLFGVFALSTSSIFIRLSSAPPLIIAAYRLIIAALILLPYVLLKHRQDLKKLDRKTVILCFVAGIFLSLHFATWNYSLTMTNIASATVLVNMHIVVTVALSFFLFRQKLGKKAIFWILLILAGTVIISLGDSSTGSNMLLGDGLAFLGAVFMSGYMMIGSVIRKKLSVSVYTCIVYSIASLVLFLASALSGTAVVGYPGKELLIFLGLAVVATMMGHSVSTWSLGFLEPVTVSSMMLLEPVCASIWAVFLFQEIPSLSQAVGGIVILVSLWKFLRMESYIEQKPMNDAYFEEREQKDRKKPAAY